MLLMVLKKFACILMVGLINVHKFSPKRRAKLEALEAFEAYALIQVQMFN